MAFSPLFLLDQRHLACAYHPALEQLGGRRDASGASDTKDTRKQYINTGSTLIRHGVAATTKDGVQTMVFSLLQLQYVTAGNANMPSYKDFSHSA